MSNKAPVLKFDSNSWVQVFRGITTATNERTCLSGNVPGCGLGNSAPAIEHTYERAIASALVLANMNSLPLDWTARFSVGGANMNFFIVKQLPVLPPEAYLDEVLPGIRYVELIVPRVLELTYTGHELEGFANDIGYFGSPFKWDECRRHSIQCELDAVFAHMYKLARAELEWILDAPYPSTSFPSLKRNELEKFGEFRTQVKILRAYDRLTCGELPDLVNE